MSRPKNNPDFVKKICKQCNIAYSVSFYKRKKSTYCSKKCSNANIDVLNKMRESQSKTYDEKYGGLHPMQTEETKVNFKKSILNKYGVTSYSKLKEYNEKVKKTKLKRYNNEKYTNLEKIKSTCLEKYGVDNVMKCNIIRDKINSKTKQFRYEFLKNYCTSRNIEILFSEVEYIGYSFKNKYKFLCKTCSKQFETDVYRLNHIFCNYCNPVDKDTIENEIYLFVKSIVAGDVIIKRKDRTILNGKELDIYIPSKNIAIEFNGLYWHSENANKIKKNYHLNKSRSCISKGIRLVHVFENEWVFKKDIVKSILRNLLHVNVNKIYARNCVVKNLSQGEKNDFLENNHIQGKDKSSIQYGLFHNDELVSLMTFVKSRFDKKIQYEMYRYCNKLNTNIVGGASKLFKQFLNEYSPNTIVSYSDKRYFDGTVYQNLGFNFIENTPPNYWYISPNYKSLYNRMTFQKHKLEKVLGKYDINLTEWENMLQNGYDRIWDCGNGKWIYNSITT
jgi:hypothetical protein